MPRRALLILASLALVSLAIAAVVMAATPKGDAKFKGRYDPAYKVGKFEAKVKFHTSSDASTVDTSKFDAPFCGGVGGPPPSKNPFAHVKFKPMAIDADGKFKGHKVRKGLGSGDFKYDEHYNVKGTFTKAKRAKGTFTVKDDFKNPATQDCKQVNHWKAKAK